MNNTVLMMDDYDKQAEEFLNKYDADIAFEYIGKMHPAWGGRQVNTYRFTISRNGASYTGTFYDSIYNTLNRIEPTAYSLLSCLEKYDVGTYQDFCDEFGYSPYDSESEEIYSRVCEEAHSVERLFGDCMDKLREIY